MYFVTGLGVAASCAEGAHPKLMVAEFRPVSLRRGGVLLNLMPLYASVLRAPSVLQTFELRRPTVTK